MRIRTIYLGSRNQYQTIVSDDDYDFLMQWRWNFKISRGGNVYARRTAGRVRGVGGYTLLMHTVILNRMGLIRPSDKHTPDHCNGSTLDNTRENLVWATPREQVLNRRHFRKLAQELLEMEPTEIPF